MAYIGNHEIELIYLGSSEPSAAYIGSFQWYPADYIYTLEVSSVRYYTNSGTQTGTQLLANSSNYVRFYCIYKKKRRSTGAVVSSEYVYANIGNNGWFIHGQSDTQPTVLMFNSAYNNREVNGGNISIGLSYGAASCTGTFSFQGNRLNTTYYVTDISYTLSSDVSAAGMDLEYSGGDVYRKKQWTSGVVDEDAYYTHAELESGTHSQSQNFYCEFDYYGKTIWVPHLGTSQLSRGYYEISVKYNDTTYYYHDIYQQANTRSITSRSLTLKDGSGNVINTSSIYQLPLTAGRLRVNAVDAKVTYHYTSGSNYTTTVYPSDYQTTFENIDGNMIDRVDTISNGSYDIVYNTQTSGSSNESYFAVWSNSYGVNASFELGQAAISYTFSFESSSGTSLTGAGGTISITYSSTKSGSAYELPSSAFSISQSFVTYTSTTSLGNGRFTAYFNCAENSSSSSRTCRITATQPGSSNSFYVDISQSAVTYALTNLSTSPLNVTGETTMTAFTVSSTRNGVDFPLSASDVVVDSTYSYTLVNPYIVDVTSASSGRYVIRVGFAANSSTTSTRTGRFKVTQQTSGLTTTFVINQDTKAKQPIDYCRIVPMSQPGGSYQIIVYNDNTTDTYNISYSFTLRNTSTGTETTTTGTAASVAPSSSRVVGGFNPPTVVPSSVSITSVTRV